MQFSNRNWRFPAAHHFSSRTEILTSEVTFPRTTSLSFMNGDFQTRSDTSLYTASLHLENWDLETWIDVSRYEIITVRGLTFPISRSDFTTTFFKSSYLPGLAANACYVRNTVSAFARSAIAETLSLYNTTFEFTSAPCYRPADPADPHLNNASKRLFALLPPSTPPHFPRSIERNRSFLEQVKSSATLWR